MSIGAEILEAQLAEPRFAEAVSYVPQGALESARVELTGRVVRRQEAEDARTDKGRRYVLRKVDLKVFATLHAAYGGVLAPQIGDTWKLPVTQGGTPVDGWKAGAPTAGDGTWTIPLTLREEVEVDAKRGQGT